MTFIRRALVVLSITALALVPTAPFVGVADAARAPIGGGSGIVIDGRYGCTMTAVGRDRTGALVGLTAAHCGRIGSAITSERHRGAGVIGRIVLRHKAGDYAVVRLDPNRVQPVRRVGGAYIAGVGAMPEFGATVCKQGRTTGHTCGPVLLKESYLSSSYVCANHGDSGGPIMSGNRVVGMLNGGQEIAGVALPCHHPAFPVFTPMIATSMVDILSDLNRRGQAGAGFRTI